MRRRWVAAVFFTVLGVCLSAAASPARAGVAEVYRSPHGWMHAVSVNPNDGSCWAVAGISVLHLDADGVLLHQFTDFAYPVTLDVNPQDGSVWVSDPCRGELIHLASDGTVLWRGGPWHAMHLSVNPADGSVWISTCDYTASDHDVVHLAADGHELYRISSVTNPTWIAASPFDGSCWVMDSPDGVGGWLKHFAADGTLLWQGTGGPCAVNANDGSVWYVTFAGAYHLSADHQPLWSTTWTGSPHPGQVAVDAHDGSCWYQQAPTGCDAALVHVDADGQELLHLQGPEWSLGAMDVDPTDGSCWAAAGSGVIHINTDGETLWEDRGFGPAGLMFDSRDGSYWMSAAQCPFDFAWLVHYDAAGQELARAQANRDISSLVLDEADGSCWGVLPVNQPGLTHYGADGTPLPWAGTLSSGAYSLVLNPGDRSLWTSESTNLRHYSNAGAFLGSVAVGGPARTLAFSPYDHSLWAVVMISDGAYALRRIAADGTVSPVDGFVRPQALSVNPEDGSIWVSDFDRVANTYRIAHLSSQGSLLWQAEPADATIFAAGYEIVGWGAPQQPWWGVAVDARNGSCWVVGRDAYLLSSSGEDLGHVQQPGFGPSTLAVNPLDGVCWISERDCNLRKLAQGPFPDVAADSWAVTAIRACIAAGIVGGYPDGDYHPEIVVTRDQMAVFIGRALAGEAVPTGPAEPTFPDVAPGTWAYDYIEYAAAQHIVGGYPDGTYGPSLDADRGQMAGFIARALAPFSERPNLPGYTPPVTPSFPDVDVASWAYPYVEYAKEAGVVGGYPDGLYHPEIACTRDQMAVFISRAFDLHP